MRVRRALPSDKDEIVPLIAEFRVVLSSFRGRSRVRDLAGARSELQDYQDKRYDIFVAEEEKSNKLVGYLVCRAEESVVWAESIFVLSEYRSRGIGARLYREAERLAEELGGDTVYNWVHPNNDGIISFLRKNGYTVLNLVEVRRRKPGENIEGKMTVGAHEFDY